jgi:hypothetical protein
VATRVHFRIRIHIELPLNRLILHCVKFARVCNIYVFSHSPFLPYNNSRILQGSGPSPKTRIHLTRHSLLLLYHMYPPQGSGHECSRCNRGQVPGGQSHTRLSHNNFLVNNGPTKIMEEPRGGQETRTREVWSDMNRVFR